MATTSGAPASALTYAEAWQRSRLIDVREYHLGLDVTGSEPSAGHDQHGAPGPRAALVITPLINSPAIGTGLTSQPTDPQVRTELYSLITLLVNCSASDPTCVQTPTRTQTIVKAACATVLGSATTLIK